MADYQQVVDEFPGEFDGYYSKQLEEMKREEKVEQFKKTVKFLLRNGKTKKGLERALFD